MDASASTPPRRRERNAARQPSQAAPQSDPSQQAGQHKQRNPWLSSLGAHARELRDWWTKVNNDWVFNLAGLLAYNFLMSLFPILLLLLAIAGLFLNRLGPQAMTTFQNDLQAALPGGTTVVPAITRQLQHSAGNLFVIALVASLITGSRLFTTIESCFSIVFRLRPRNVIRQNIMALGMLLLYIVLIPVITLGAVIPSAILTLIKSVAANPIANVVIQVAGILLSVAFAYLFLAAIYIVVPNRKVRYNEVWKGTLVAAALLVIYNLAFPFYETRFLHPNNYGSVAGFAIVILVFFYYLGLILLIGAEVNSWAAGQRQTLGDISAILHEVQAHDTTRGVAGPTAGLPQEDIAHRRGAEAMGDTESAVEHERVNHAHDAQPAPPAEAHLPGPPYESEEQRRRDWEQADEAVKAEHDQRPAPGAPAPHPEGAHSEAEEADASTRAGLEQPQDHDPAAPEWHSPSALSG